MKRYIPVFLVCLILSATSCDRVKNFNPFRKKVDHTLIEQQRQDSIRQAQEQEARRMQEAEELARLESLRQMEEIEKQKPVRNYHLIVGSFRNPDYASRFHQKIQSQGNDSQILMAKNGFHLVTMSSYDNFREAVKELRSMTNAGQEVWLYIDK